MNDAYRDIVFKAFLVLWVVGMVGGSLLNRTKFAKGGSGAKIWLTLLYGTYCLVMYSLLVLQLPAKDRLSFVLFTIPACALFAFAFTKLNKKCKKCGAGHGLHNGHAFATFCTRCGSPLNASKPASGDQSLE